MNSIGIVAYTYRADIYCPECIILQMDSIVVTEGGELAHKDGSPFSYEEFPNAVFADQIANDSPMFCATCRRALNPAAEEVVLVFDSQPLTRNESIARELEFKVNDHILNTIDTIVIECPHCGAEIERGDPAATSMFLCPECGEEVTR